MSSTVPDHLEMICYEFNKSSKKIVCTQPQHHNQHRQSWNVVSTVRGGVLRGNAPGLAVRLHRALVIQATGRTTMLCRYEYLSQLSEKRASLFTEFVKSNAALFSGERPLRGTLFNFWRDGKSERYGGGGDQRRWRWMNCEAVFLYRPAPCTWLYIYI
ncbi:hypothetical protein CBL_00890 [Carabus blaptoides fortunei]